MVGCKSTSHAQQACKIDLRFNIDSTLHKKRLIDLSELHRDVTKKYPSTEQSSQVIELTLIKAYVRPDAYILKATAVLSSKNKHDNSLRYHRASHIDANIANLDDEYQVAITDAVFLAIDEVIDAETQACVALKS